MNRILTFVALSFMLLALCVPTEAQQTKKVLRIGLLSATRPSPMPPAIEALRQGLRELGYFEGQNIIVEYRWADGKDDRYAPLAAELVSLGVDVNRNSRYAGNDRCQASNQHDSYYRRYGRRSCG